MAGRTPRWSTGFQSAPLVELEISLCCVPRGTRVVLREAKYPLPRQDGPSGQTWERRPMGESRAMTLLELLYLLKKRLKLVIVLPLVCALAVGMYVLVQHDNANSNSLSSDLSASQMVTNDMATPPQVGPRGA